MLIEIKSEALIEKRIKFEKGLNIVVGDGEASNSIGKSTFLLIIDLIFGGETYLKKIEDICKNIGKHEYKYKFKFFDKEYHFKKIISLEEKQKIYICDKNYLETMEIKDSDYKNFLLEKYNLKSLDMSFREVVGLYSRIWGKDNAYPKKPLNNISKEKEETAINRFIKLYDKYEIIKQQEEQKDKVTLRYSVLTTSFKNNILNKLTKKEYESNKKRILKLKMIKKNFSENLIAQILEEKNKKNSEKYLELKKEEKKIRIQKIEVDSKINILKNESNGKNTLTTDELEKIKIFFPNIDISRIKEIEKFHTTITKYLIDEIREEIKNLEELKEGFEIILYDISRELKKIIDDIGVESSEIVEELIKIITELESIEKDNSNYEEHLKMKEDKDILNSKLEKVKLKILENIMIIINNKMKLINKEICKEHESPILEMTPKNYFFKVDGNDGTGREFENLLVFDLSVILTTSLPFLIHDSFLFKNISKEIMENIILEYHNISENKQIFISIDEIQRYKKEVIDIITSKEVLKLGKNRYLFNKNWGK